MQTTQQLIPLDQIEIAKDYDLHPWQETLVSGGLLASFEKFGILHPPLVKAISDQKFLLVTGKKRFSYAQEALLSSISCLIIEDYSGEDITDFIFEDQTLTAPLTLVEKARLLQIFQEVTGKSPSHTFLKKLALPGNPRQIEQLLHILTQPLELIEAIHSGFVKEKMTWELLRLGNKKERLGLLQFFQLLGLGDGKQRRFLQMLKDIAYKEHSTITEILSEESIQDVLVNSDANVPQKINILGTKFQQMLTPALSAAQQSFAEKLRIMKLPDSFEVTPSTSFEKDAITLSITLHNIECLESRIHELKTLFSDQDCDSA